MKMTQNSCDQCYVWVKMCLVYGWQYTVNYKMIYSVKNSIIKTFAMFAI